MKRLRTSECDGRQQGCARELLELLTRRLSHTHQKPNKGLIYEERASESCEVVRSRDQALEPETPSEIVEGDEMARTRVVCPSVFDLLDGFAEEIDEGTGGNPEIVEDGDEGPVEEEPSRAREGLSDIERAV